MREVFAVVTVVVLTTSLAQGAEWLIPYNVLQCNPEAGGCLYSHAIFGADGAKPETFAKQVYTVQEVNGIKAGLQTDIQTARTELKGELTNHKNEVTTALDGHKTDVAGKLKGLITPELLAEIRKELVPEVTKEVIAELRKQGLLDRP